MAPVFTGADKYSKCLSIESSKYTTFKGCNVSMDIKFTSVSFYKIGLRKRICSSLDNEIRLQGNTEIN